MCREAAQEVLRLDHLGVPFNRTPEGKLAHRRLHGSSVPRALFAADFTGHAVLHTLYEQFLKEAIQAYDEWLVTSLVIADGTCRGLLALELRTGEVAVFAAPAVILATGGAGRLYDPSTASLSCTGDGMSLAYRAGLRLMNMEMVQYHPLGFRGRRAFASEATLTEGAVLCDQAGQSVLQNNGSLTRDHLCRLLVSVGETQGVGGGLFLDLRPLGKDAIASRFINLQRAAQELAGVNLDREPLPVRPLMHRLLGGIEITTNGATTIPGLFAVGECACPGVHGANALAGNAFTASVVFGRRAGVAAAAYAREVPPTHVTDARLRDEQQYLAALFSRQPGEDTAVRIGRELATLITEKVGLVRDGGGLALAAERLRLLQERHARLGLRHHGKMYNHELTSFFELGSLLDVAEAIVAAAQARKESRGVHHRSDFPQSNDGDWCKHSLVSRGTDGPRVETRPVNTGYSM
jgi:succinate dehydrogenase / fumarate reductase flavoprotein subunit